TIRDLAITALKQNKKPKAAIKAVRKLLHSIMAPYLGDPDYETMAVALDATFKTGDAEAIEDLCLAILNDHLSNRERVPIMGDFFTRIWEVTGQPKVLMDIACALNPLAFLWMDLPITTQIYAYDIHEPRIEFINHYFSLQGLAPLAKVQDVALEPIVESADVALFLKEMPRFARNYPGQERLLLESIKAEWLVLSFPTVSTHGGRNLTDRYRDFMTKLVDGHDWPVIELLFDGELVCCVHKGLA
ncbi:MAG: hypothetical protein AAF490_23335, partial [Chloroflexota bacterium]